VHAALGVLMFSGTLNKLLILDVSHRTHNCVFFMVYRSSCIISLTTVAATSTINFVFVKLAYF